MLPLHVSMYFVDADHKGVEVGQMCIHVKIPHPHLPSQAPMRQRRDSLDADLQIRYPQL